MLVRLQEGYLKTKFGTFLEVLYYDGQKESVALVMGDISNSENVLCRIHSSCLSAHVFNSIECDCREQMEMAQFLIEQEGRGIIIWLEQEGRNNGHLALLSTSKLRANGMSSTEAYLSLGFKEDARDYRCAVEILQDLKVASVTLLTNSPQKIDSLRNSGINVAGSKRIAIDASNNEELEKTYKDKIMRGHLIDL
ncbi:GTP cyclohydrolase II RibA [Leptolyngbya sp. O-77]|uniref:GTP cyclohydrolase II RibA n=1 Tax=Leptolyngbya sp. O-77 TaxID=1080068 RepID=UPI00074D30D5|nr:GTP cyclohydrolase II RibA [Leptolyngbya sp. O-77]BAU42138.1 GTP cyclohydrolase-2 [Leptolyngbya sp. O-77]